MGGAVAGPGGFVTLSQWLRARPDLPEPAAVAAYERWLLARWEAARLLLGGPGCPPPPAVVAEEDLGGGGAPPGADEPLVASAAAYAAGGVIACVAAALHTADGRVLEARAWWNVLGLPEAAPEMWRRMDAWVEGGPAAARVAVGFGGEAVPFPLCACGCGCRRMFVPVADPEACREALARARALAH